MLSLVLVALALLMRLLMAASEIRVPELALASLRGVSSRRLWVLGLAEPLVVLPSPRPSGSRSGWAWATAWSRAWLVPGPAAAAAVGQLGGRRAGAASPRSRSPASRSGWWCATRWPPSSPAYDVRWPSRRWSVVAQLTLVALAARRAGQQARGRRTAGDPDATDLVLPVLLAVVAGLAATRLTAWLATWWTRRRSHGRSLSGFVSARAISRRQEGTLVILPMTAAIAVAVFGAGVYDSAATWRTSVAATASPGDVTWTSPLSLRETRDLTRRIDPDGEWVMAAAEVQNPGANFSIVDADRLAADRRRGRRPGARAAASRRSPRASRPRATCPTWSAGGSPSPSTTRPTDLATRSPSRCASGSVGGTPERVYVGPFPARRAHAARAGCRGRAPPAARSRA